MIENEISNINKRSGEKSNKKRKQKKRIENREYWEGVNFRESV